MLRLGASRALLRRQHLASAAPLQGLADQLLPAGTASSAAAAASASASARGMATYTAPLNEMKFALHDVHGFAEHYATLQHVTECEKEDIDMVVEASAQMCEQDLSPLLDDADKVGAVWHNDLHIETAPGTKAAYDMYCENGWQGLSFPTEYGGQGLPMSLALIQSEMMAAANWTFLMFPGLSKGAINTIMMHGTEELKDKYLPPLVSGEMTGTMCLTEPGCGSDLGQVITKAERDDADGSYTISGTKIFISCGDHDLTDNIVHCVLARLPDAPAAAAAPKGTKGISLFLVPKRLEDGSLNGVTTSRIEHKMGCHGSPTCQLEFENAKGWLIGAENKGMGHMFTFINTSRVGTAVQGVAAAENAFQNSLWYCKDRKSMRALSGAKEPDEIADPIIHHPAVRTMLLTMKAYSEGGRSMVYECAQIADKMLDAEKAGDEAAAKELDGRLGFLTPILKGFLTEAGKEAADLGIQVYGGHGYIQDNHAERNYRDVRIAAVWEGTTQIQALDLLGRKIMLGKLTPIFEHCRTLAGQALPIMFSSDSSPGMRKRALSLLMHAGEWCYLTMKIAATAKGNPEVVSSSSEPYLMFAGHVSLASHWLQMEAVASKKLAELKKGGVDEDEYLSPEFYQSKVATSQYVFDALLPRTRSLARQMFTPIGSIMQMDKDHFSFDHAQ